MSLKPAWLSRTLRTGVIVLAIVANGCALLFALFFGFLAATGGDDMFFPPVRAAVDSLAVLSVVSLNAVALISPTAFRSSARYAAIVVNTLLVLRWGYLWADNLGIFSGFWRHSDDGLPVVFFGLINLAAIIVRAKRRPTETIIASPAHTD